MSRMTELTAAQADELIDDQAELEEWHALQAQLRYLTLKRDACLRVKQLEEPARRMLQIINARFFHGYTLEQCASIYGLTRERIRQIEGKAFYTMRRAAIAKGKRQDIADLLVGLDETRSAMRSELAL